MAHTFCAGYNRQPFSTLVRDYPGEDVYPSADFRTEWGPIFHRGRLDRTARIVVIGQDPAAHESIARRILVGEAGQRVQGLLAKVGITSSYVLVNTFLYSVYGSGGNRHADDPVIAAYRTRWLDALVRPPTVTAVLTLGTLADQAYNLWATERPAVAAQVHHAAIRHPTYPESASRSGSVTLAEATKILLADWNAKLTPLRSHVQPEAALPSPKNYAAAWRPADLAPIPEADLPAGCPPWMRALDSWATRTGADAQLKRATITVAVPRSFRIWPVIGAT